MSNLSLVGTPALAGSCSSQELSRHQQQLSHASQHSENHHGHVVNPLRLLSRFRRSRASSSGASDCSAGSAEASASSRSISPCPIHGSSTQVDKVVDSNNSEQHPFHNLSLPFSDALNACLHFQAEGVACTTRQQRIRTAFLLSLAKDCDRLYTSVCLQQEEQHNRLGRHFSSGSSRHSSRSLVRSLTMSSSSPSLMMTCSCPPAIAAGSSRHMSPRGSTTSSTSSHASHEHTADKCSTDGDQGRRASARTDSVSSTTSSRVRFGENIVHTSEDLFASTSSSVSTSSTIGSPPLRPKISASTISVMRGSELSHLQAMEEYDVAAHIHYAHQQLKHVRRDLYHNLKHRLKHFKSQLKACHELDSKNRKDRADAYKVEQQEEVRHEYCAAQETLSEGVSKIHQFYDQQRLVIEAHYRKLQRKINPCSSPGPCRSILKRRSAPPSQSVQL